MNVRFVYIPRPKGLMNKRSQFQSAYGKTLRDLDYELSRLRVVDVTIQAGFPADKIRLDGWPYGKVVPEHPAVVLQFRRGADILSFSSLKYASFEENLRAITLTLAALRAVDRYGVVEGEQYAGFKRLAPPDLRADFIARYSDGSAAEDIDFIYRAAARRLHPDAGGSHEDFVGLQAAYAAAKGGLEK